MKEKKINFIIKAWKGKSKKQIIQKIIPVSLIPIGLILLLYPWISNYLFENRADSLITTYENEIEEMDNSKVQEMLQNARKYNELLYSNPVDLGDPFGTNTKSGNDDMSYDNLLRINNEGLMGMIEIPKIKVKLPIYHGTSNEVLDKGVGHLYGTSLPIGGTNTHAVLTAHTGMRNAKLFTDLTELKKEDLFFINILDEKLAYKVISINIVKPDDVSLLSIQKAKDLVTLVTCTPYSVNSHRLMVTGIRTEYTEQTYKAETEKRNYDSLWMRTYRDALLIGALVVLILLLMELIRRRIVNIMHYKKINQYNIEQSQKIPM